MSKRAEEAALKVYDEEWQESLRLAFQEGYEQAEKDLREEVVPNKAEEIKTLADDMYYAAQYLTTDASHLRKAMEAYYQYIAFHYHLQEKK